MPERPNGIGLKLIPGGQPAAERPSPPEDFMRRANYIDSVARWELCAAQNRQQLIATFSSQIRQVFPQVSYRALYLEGERVFEDGLLELGKGIVKPRGLLEASLRGAGMIPAGSTVCFEAASPDRLRYIPPQYISRWAEDTEKTLGVRAVEIGPGVLDLEPYLGIRGTVVVAPLKTATEDRVYGALVLVHAGGLSSLEPVLASQYAAEVAIEVRTLSWAGRLAPDR